MASLPELRHRAWIIANNTIEYINKTNEIFYSGLNNKPAPLEKIEKEEVNNITFIYIQELVNKAKNILTFETLSEIANLVDYVQKKHKETLQKYKNLNS